MCLAVIPLLKHCLPNLLCIKCKLIIIAYKVMQNLTHLSLKSHLWQSSMVTIFHLPLNTPNSLLFLQSISLILHRGLPLTTLLSFHQVSLFNIYDYIIFCLHIIYLLRDNISSWDQGLSSLFIYDRCQAQGLAHRKH